MRRIHNRDVIALVLCVSLITLFCISSYDWKDKYPWPIGDIDNTIVPIEGLSVRLVEGTLSRTGFSFIVENTGHDLVIFGASYYLQVYRKGSWYAIDNSPSEWTAEGYVVPCDESHYFTRDWSSIYGELPDGKYRFIWPFRYVDKDFRLISDEKFRLSLEFDIKTNEQPFKGFTGEKAEMMENMLKTNFPQIWEGDGVKWNFTKFLVDREGNVVGRFEPTVDPQDIEKEIEKFL